MDHPANVNHSKTRNSQQDGGEPLLVSIWSSLTLNVGHTC